MVKNQEPVLVVMAAGMGSRFGGLKQMTPVDGEGCFIIDYSLYDAYRAGFRRVAFIIKKELEEAFRQTVGHRMERFFEVHYIYQELTHLPEGYAVPEGRPWGTAHAVACCRGVVDAPFAAINADDFYGRGAFEAVYRFLKESTDEHAYCMAGYRLVNTLSDKGTVARGICTVDANGKLTDIDERLKIGWTADGRITDVSREVEVEYDPQTPVSMNCWGCPPELMEEFQPRFIHFLEHMEDPLKSEFLLPEMIGNLLHEGCAEVTVLPVHNKWYGVTYREDHEKVAAAMAALTADGLYPEKLK